MTEADATEAPELHCPECGGADLVKAHLTERFTLKLRFGARCITCDHRFRVDADEFESLRTPVLGEPYETLLDRHVHMLHTPMRRGHARVCIAGLLIGLALGILLINLFNAPIWMFILFLPGMYIGWWVGRRLYPPAERAPGKCLQCLYDLRGSTGMFCPECGRRIDPEEAIEPGREASEYR